MNIIDTYDTPSKSTNLLENIDSNITRVEAVSKDIDDLSYHLSSVFRSFPT